MLETSGNEGVSIIEACTIKKGEEIATDNDIESEVAMDEPTVDIRVETFSMSPVSETSAVEPVCQHMTEDKESGGNETKVEADAYKGEIAEEVTMGETTEDGNTEDSYPLILETSVVVVENQRETGETGGGGKKGKVRSRFGWKVIQTGFRSERKPNRVKENSAKIRPERKLNRAETKSTER